MSSNNGVVNEWGAQTTSSEFPLKQTKFHRCGALFSKLDILFGTGREETMQGELMKAHRDECNLPYRHCRHGTPRHSKQPSIKRIHHS